MPDARTRSNTTRTSRLRELSALDWTALVIVVVAVSFLIVLHHYLTAAFIAMYQDFGVQILPMYTRGVIQSWYPIMGALASLALVAQNLLSHRASLLRRRGGFHARALKTRD